MMATKSLIFTILPDPYTVCRMAPGTPPPEWNKKTEFFSITHSKDEITMVCLSKNVPEEVHLERDWRILKILGPPNYSMAGTLASVAGALKEADISILAISTFDTDFFLVRENKLAGAVEVLKAAGHRFFGD